MNHKQRDRARLFSLFSHPDLAVGELVGRYLDYHGGIDFGHQTLLFERLRRAVGEPELQLREVVGEDWRINDGFLRRFAPEFGDAYYAPGPDDFDRRLLLPASVNQWRADIPPVPFNHRLALPERPELQALIAPPGPLFVGPYGYQRFDPASGRAWASAASRALPRGVEQYRRVAVESPVAVIQDRFDGANLAHFLYDGLPRIMQLTAALPDLARRCRFLMGGEPGAFHSLILGRLCERHGLRPEQFEFPPENEIWMPSGPLVFFSDQIETPLHPLHMAHPHTLAMVRALMPPGIVANAPRLYVSRADADSRRIVNEPRLIAALAREGYVSVRPGELDPARQIGLFAGARHIVAPHGMGLANLVFHRGGGTLLELFNGRIGTDAYAFVARATGMDYGFAIGATTAEARLDTEVDVDEVLTLARSLDPATSRTERSLVPEPLDRPTPPPRRMLSDAELLQQFESLGVNCEFGLVQRFVGAEPLGFFRFNYAPFPSLMEMLENELRDIDLPEDIELERAHDALDAELIVRNRRYHYRYHTFLHDADAEPVRARQIRVIGFLKDKLLSDLRSAEKIFVRTGLRAATEASALLRLLRRYGPATLLWVTPAEETSPSGTVRVLEPGLLRGSIDRLAPPPNAYDLSPAWLTVCRNAHALRVGGCVPGTVIMPPRSVQPTNLLRKSHFTVQPHSGWWVSAESRAEVVTDGPARTDAAHIRWHQTSIDTTPATSSLCGVAMRHGLVPEAVYVASAEVWIPEEADVRQVGMVFNGLASIRVSAADLARRGAWQRVWVTARAPMPEARMNPSLSVVGKAGAALYSAGWQLELGHFPGPLVPNTTGILRNLGPTPASFRQGRAE